jgi:hypothetical protein
MRKTLRWRYYCEFCKKAGNSAFHMEKHEKGCTLNPHRKCRMCDFVAGIQKPIAELIVLLPNPDDFKEEVRDSITGEFLYTSFNVPDEPISKGLQALREATDNCPACIMAAIRQRGIPVPAVMGFNFTQECKDVWAQVNDDRRQEYY